MTVVVDRPVAVYSGMVPGFVAGQYGSSDLEIDVLPLARRAGARLVVFPEVFIAGYPDWVWVVENSNGPVLNDLYLRLVESAVSIPDASTDRLCAAAREAGIHVVMGLHERNAEASNAGSR